MKGVFGGFVAALVGVLLSVTPVSAAETVITARVMPVRHIVVNESGSILRIVSNTSENVRPIVHLNTINGEVTSLTPDIEARYKTMIATLDMSRPVVYARKSPFKILLAHLKLLTVAPLKTLQ